MWPFIIRGLLTAYLLVLQDTADRALQREQIFHDHAELCAESDEYLFVCFKLPRAVLMERLEPAQQCNTQQSNSVPPHLQVISGYFSRIWETGWAYHSHLLAALSRESWTIPQAQAISFHQYLLNVVSRFPGGAQYSFILQNSSVSKEQMAIHGSLIRIF